ncbi:MAG: KamA family radical SAM protein [Planctomycetota bacterium]|jgi:KamA family protein
MVLIRNSRTRHVEGNGSRRRVPLPLLARPKAGLNGAARPPRYRAVTRLSIAQLPQWHAMDPALREAVEIVSLVLPFRTNEYVVNELINWDRVPDDPMFQLTFPQRRMLNDEHYETIRRLVRAGADGALLAAEVNRIRYALNPHPAGQRTHNIPRHGSHELPGAQHKYRETVLFFPSRGQTCHAFCTFCFRWPQFVGLDGLKFAARESQELVGYLRAHPEVTDVLLTGGDPLIMNAGLLRRYLEPILALDSVRTIRFGTKAPAFWPHRFVTDDDADDLLRLFERIVATGRHLAVMGHYSHPVELSTEVARRAVQRIRSTGATVRLQAPLLRHVNDRPGAWADLWSAGVALGAVPYYMFVERDTGARHYFEVPLIRCWRIFREAYRQVSGLGRTVRGPVMSCFPGKCHVLGVSLVGGQRAFVLEFLQARDPELVRRPFFARYDPQVTWFDELTPLTAADAPFFLSSAQAAADPRAPRPVIAPLPI